MGVRLKIKEGSYGVSLCVGWSGEDGKGEEMGGRGGEQKEADMPEKERKKRGERSRGARAMSWIEYHLTGPAGSLPTPQHRKTPQYGGQLLLPA